jgi:hypothetical protein
METKIIQYYVRETYGMKREYVKNPIDAQILFSLTKQRTINQNIRSAISALSENRIMFEQVLP